MKNLYFTLIMLLLVACQVTESTSTEIQKEDLLPFKSSLMHYLPSNYSMDYEHIFENEQGEQTKLLVGGEGYAYDEERKTITAITKNLSGRINQKSFQMHFVLDSGSYSNAYAVLNYGILSYGNCPLSKVDLQKNQSKIKDLNLENQITMMYIKSTDTLQNPICQKNVYSNPACQIELNYEMCLETNKGLSSFRFEGDQWTYVQSVKIDQ